MERPSTCDNRFVQDHRLPRYSYIEVERSNKIVINWKGYQMETLESLRPDLFRSRFGNGRSEIPMRAKIELQPGRGEMTVHYRAYDGFEGYTFTTKTTLDKAGIYPLSYENALIRQYAGLKRRVGCLFLLSSRGVNQIPCAFLTLG